MAFQNVKGTRDFYPNELMARKVIFAKMSEVAKKYGYQEVEAPAMEYKDLLTAKSGEEVSHQIFVLEKRSNESIGLRFDLTVPLTRMFMARQKEIVKPVKWFSLSRMWRYEKPQAGRLREFYQLDVEVFGSDKPEADAEVISLAIDVLQSFGLTKDDIIIKINNRDLLEGFLSGIGVKELEALLRVIDRKSKITPDEFKRDLIMLSVDQFKKVLDYLEILDLDEVAKLTLNKKAQNGLANVRQVLSLLESMGKKDFVHYDPSIARGLAYYTGTVFECFDRAGNFRAILGGGRYDNMVELFGGESTPATGFAIGDVVIELFLKEKGLWPATKLGCDYFIATMDDATYKKGLELAKELRKRYSVQLDIMQRKFGKQLNYANSINAKKVIIIGEEELRNNDVTIKDMASGKQEKVPMDKVKEL